MKINNRSRSQALRGSAGGTGSLVIAAAGAGGGGAGRRCDIGRGRPAADEGHSARVQARTRNIPCTRSPPPTARWCGNTSRRTARCSAWRGGDRSCRTSSRFWATATRKFAPGRAAGQERGGQALAQCAADGGATAFGHAFGRPHARLCGNAYVPGLVPAGVDTKEIR